MSESENPGPVGPFWIDSRGGSGGAGRLGETPPAPPVATGLSRGRKVLMVLKVVELRLRFIALLVATGLVFGYWDTIWNHYAKWTRPAREPIASAPDFEFYCPMHPNVVQSEAGSCPICGMPLSKRKKGDPSSNADGVARVELAPFRVRQAGIRTLEVGYAPLLETISTVGYVEHDERLLRRIDSKIPGRSRVEKLHVNFEGMPVQAGQLLAEVYAPELDAALRELLLNQRHAEEAAASRSSYSGQLQKDARELVKLSTEKLTRWGIGQAQIDEVLRTRRAEINIPITSPIGGHILEKNVVEGQYVAEGDPMFVVADLGQVWIRAKVFEDQIPLIRVGQEVEATVPAYPGEVFAGRVAFLYPHLDPATRTIDVRYDIENPGHRIRPGMFATVTIKTPVSDLPAFRDRVAQAPKARMSLASLTVAEQEICPVTMQKLGSMGDPVPVDLKEGKVWTCCGACTDKVEKSPAKFLARLQGPPKDQVLSVPESAVIDSGSRTLVYVEVQPGVFEGREVVLGPRSGDRYPVLDGLMPGESVAAAGAFLIDAETRLNPAAGSTYFGGSGSSGGAHKH